MAESSQKFMARNRAPRVQIEYDVELYGAQKKVQLPFVMGVMSDLAGKSNQPQPAVSDRKFLEIDVDNFDERMRAIAPRAAFSVPNTLTGEGNLAIDLTFESMRDFTPGAVAARVDALRPLLEARTQLVQLMTYMDGKTGAETLIEKVLGDPALLGALVAGAPDAARSAETEAALAGLRDMAPEDLPQGGDETGDVLAALAAAAPEDDGAADEGQRQAGVLDALRAQAPQDIAAQAPVDLGAMISDLGAGAATTPVGPSVADVLAGIEAPQDDTAADAPSEADAVLAGLERATQQDEVPQAGSDHGAVLSQLAAAAPAEVQSGDETDDILAGIAPLDVPEQPGDMVGSVLASVAAQAPEMPDVEDDSAAVLADLAAREPEHAAPDDGRDETLAQLAAEADHAGRPQAPDQTADVLAGLAASGAARADAPVAEAVPDLDAMFAEMDAGSASPEADDVADILGDLSAAGTSEEDLAEEAVDLDAMFAEMDAGDAEPEADDAADILGDLSAAGASEEDLAEEAVDLDAMFAEMDAGDAEAEADDAADILGDLSAAGTSEEDLAEEAVDLDAMFAEMDAGDAEAEADDAAEEDGFDLDALLSGDEEDAQASEEDAVDPASDDAGAGDFDLDALLGEDEDSGDDLDLDALLGAEDEDSLAPEAAAQEEDPGLGDLDDLGGLDDLDALLSDDADETPSPDTVSADDTAEEDDFDLESLFGDLDLDTSEAEDTGEDDLDAFLDGLGAEAEAEIAEAGAEPEADAEDFDLGALDDLLGGDEGDDDDFDLDSLLGDLGGDEEALDEGDAAETPSGAAEPAAAGAKPSGKAQLSYGALSADRPEPKKLERKRFRIAILGDFTGRAARGLCETGDQLAARKPMTLDPDTFEDVIESFATELVLPVGSEGGGISVKLGEFDDLHPDELYDNVALFSELAGLRKQLMNGSSQAHAQKTLTAFAEKYGTPARAPKSRSAGNAVPADLRLSDFQRLIGDTDGSSRPLAEASPVEDMLARVVGPHIKALPDPSLGAMQAAVDQALSDAMRLVLHHPEFQSLEAQWRSLDLIARSVEVDDTLDVMLYDVSAEELAADLATHEDLAQSGFVRLLTEEPMDEENGRGAYSVLVGMYTFEETPPHAEILARIARVAAHVDAPFLAAITPGFLDTPKDERPKLVAEGWDTLRAMNEAGHLGLLSPRFLLRRPYGKRSEPIDPFDFEEFTRAKGLRGMLWGNPVVLATILMAQSFKKNGAHLNLGSVMSMGGMPYHYVEDRFGDQVALPCTERNIDLDKIALAGERGIMTLAAVRGRDEIRLTSFNALAGGALRGPWSSEPVPEPTPAPAAKSSAAAPAAEEEEAQSDDLDLGLDFDLDFDDDTTGGDDSDDDLDALLASFGDDSDDDDSGDGDLDADLEALLNDL